MRALLLFLLLFGSADAATLATTASKAAPLTATTTTNPILFVTQVPTPNAYSQRSSAFNNQLGDINAAPKGGDLWIWYPDGTLRNLTQEVGFGQIGRQGATAIAVRDPAVSWDATKAVFSMVVGAPPSQYHNVTVYWQLYEITGFGQGQTPTITRVANQPSDANNVQPAYAQDGGIIFASDYISGHRTWLWPQLDEYEEQPTTTGLWKLSTTGALSQLTDAPSGDQYPVIDAYGRVVYTQWDHLQQDQQCEPDEAQQNGCADSSSEAQDATRSTNLLEVFPEPRYAVGHHKSLQFNQFFPWSSNSDGTSPEIIDHLGRHEFMSYFQGSLDNDPNVVDFGSGQHRFNNFFAIALDPNDPSHYIGVDGPEFSAESAGAIVGFHASPGAHADQLPPIEYLTDNNGGDGKYRDPIILSDGTFVAAYVTNTGLDSNLGSATNPNPAYKFRINRMQFNGTRWTAGMNITGGITKNVSWWSPDQLVTYNGPLWELEPVEVAVRAIPPQTSNGLLAPEQAAFTQAGVDQNALKAYMVQHDLVLFTSRNVTSRDDADHQQPFNLRVPGGVQTLGASGTIYDVTRLQIIEADALRTIGGVNDPKPGRRRISRYLNDAAALAANPPVGTAPAGSVAIAPDGSAAWFAPSNRAVSWQLTDAAGNPIVRERYWLHGQPGEIRACDSCHGVNTLNQAGQTTPQNTPAALVSLLQYWQSQNGGGGQCTNTQPDETPICADGQHETGGMWQQDPFPGCAWHYINGVCPPPQQCINPPPDQTPLCPDGSHQTGGTWTQSPFPDCGWTYSGGQCPIAPPSFTITISQGTATSYTFDNSAPIAATLIVDQTSPRLRVHWRVSQSTIVRDYPNGNALKWTQASN